MAHTCVLVVRFLFVAVSCQLSALSYERRARRCAADSRKL